MVCFDDAQGLQFNLSHSGDVILVATALDAPVGVDVERWLTDIQILGVVKSLLPPDEYTTFVLLPFGHQVASFFVWWTRMEAYLKAIGTGWHRRLHQLDLMLNLDPRGLHLTDCSASRDPNRWQVIDVEVEAGYSAALVAAKSAVVSSFNLTPTQIGHDS